jgi:hypothetical protein
MSLENAEAASTVLDYVAYSFIGLSPGWMLTRPGQAGRIFDLLRMAD